MPNIFDGLKRLSHEELIDKIVILESVNIKNFSMPVFQSIGKRIVNTVNYLGDKLGKNPNLKEVKVKYICDIMKEKRLELAPYTMDVLNERLIKALTEKLKLNNFNLSDDALSAKIIDEASKHYSLDDDMTPANKADYIFRHLENSSELDRVVSNFTSFNPINGSRKLNREILCYIVYCSVLSYGKCFTPENNSLPSYVEGDDELKKNEEDDNFILFKKHVKNLQDNVVFYENKINELNNDISDQKSHIGELEVLIDNSEFKIAEHRREKIDLQASIDEKSREVAAAKAAPFLKDNNHKLEKMEDDLDDLYEELEEVNDEIASLEEKIKDCKNEIPDCKDNIIKISSNIEEIKADHNKAIGEYDNENYKLIMVEEKRKSNLKEKWSAFTKSDFDEIIYAVICTLRLREIYEIERAIVELESLNDYASISIGLISYNKSDYENIKVKISEDKTACIMYKCPVGSKEKLRIAGITIE